MIARSASGVLGAGLGLLALAACQSLADERSATSADLIITGGTVFDGTGAEGRLADLVIDKGRIQYIGRDAAARFKAKRLVEAAGLIVAPGFIDPHTHADDEIASDDAKERANLAFAMQGVTTVMLGNDGYGTPDIAAQAEEVLTQGIGTNIAYLAGFGPIREAALGKDNRAPDPAELEQMKALARSAMCEGAWGLSAGLYYAPQNYAATQEVVEIASVAGAMGGYFDTHMRDESTYNITVTGAVKEALEIGRRAQIPVHISHIKALGPAVWGDSAKMIALIEAAQAKGQRVTADQYPWAASGTRISNALVPRWALAGGLAALRERLDDPAEAARIREGMIEGLARRGGAEKLLVTGILEDAPVTLGQTLAQTAEAMQLEPVDAAIAILRAGDARVASFNMAERDIAAFARQDWVVTGSDGSTGHPRKYASFPKAYRDLVTNGGMSLAHFIRRSSGATADLIGLTDRGYLKPGLAGDVVIFDADQFAPRATYEQPTRYSVGVRHLIVNGTALITDGEHTGALPGQPLLKDTSC
jgi:N-acyl-D-aspartate/D-glutamate deacylase